MKDHIINNSKILFDPTVYSLLFGNISEYADTIVYKRVFGRRFDVNIINAQFDDYGYLSHYGEDVSVQMMGTVLDYLTRLVVCHDLTAFDFLLSDRFINQLGVERAKCLINLIGQCKESFQNVTIDALLKQQVLLVFHICRYEQYFRSGYFSRAQIRQISNTTFKHLILMLKRSNVFFNKYGKPLLAGYYSSLFIKHGFNNIDAYAGQPVSSLTAGLVGDGDYLLKNALVDFKVAQERLYPTDGNFRQWQNQLFLYYLGLNQAELSLCGIMYSDIKYLIDFDPRNGSLYRIDLHDFTDDDRREMLSFIKSSLDKRTVILRRYVNKLIDLADAGQLATGEQLNKSRNPFYNYKNGIYKIDRFEYNQLYKNLMRNPMVLCRWPGDLYMIKHDDFYMFFIKSKSGLCILRGGSRKHAEHDLKYYYDNLPKFGQVLKHAFKSYQSYLTEISREIKQIGGSGRIHGSIVDIDFWNHIYLDPMTGNIKIYWAFNTHNRRLFSSINGLLENCINKFNLHDFLTADYSYLLENYKKYTAKMPLLESGRMPNELMLPEEAGRLLTQAFSKSDRDVYAYNDESYYDQTLYARSRAMIGVQKMLKHNIAVFWNDDILKHDYKLVSVSRTQMMRQGDMHLIESKNTMRSYTESREWQEYLQQQKQEREKHAREQAKKRKHREKIVYKERVGNYIKKYSPELIKAKINSRDCLCKKYQKVKFLKVARLNKSRNIVANNTLIDLYWLLLRNAFELNIKDWDKLAHTLKLSVCLTKVDRRTLDMAYNHIQVLLSQNKFKPKFDVIVSCGRYGKAFAHLQLGKNYYLLDFCDDKLINEYALDALFRTDVKDKTKKHLAIFKVWTTQLVYL